MQPNFEHLVISNRSSLILKRPKCLITYSQPKNKILGKRCPKYLNKLSISGYYLDAKFTRSLKGLKLLRSVILHRSELIVHEKQFIHELKRLRRFINRFEGVDAAILIHFPYISESSLQVFNQNTWRRLVYHDHLTKLGVRLSKKSLQGTVEYSKALEKLRWRFMKIISKLRTLQCFGIMLSSQNAPLGFMALEKLGHFMSILKGLQALNIVYDEENNSSSNCNNELSLLSVFPYVTMLSISNVSLPTHNVFLKHIDAFNKLCHLSFDFQAEDEYEDNGGGVTLECLSHLQKLVNLQSISIGYYTTNKKYIQEFFRNFSMPKSLESITLSLRGFAWETVISYKVGWHLEQLNPFEEQEEFKKFFNKWAGLDNLKTLSITLEDFSSYAILNEYFIVPILKKLTALENLEYNSSIGTSIGVNKIPMNFKYFWNALGHLTKSLKTLTMSDLAISMRKFEDVGGEMSRLESAFINGAVLGDTKLVNLVKLLPETKAGPPKTNLFINHLNIESDESFVDFLKVFVYIPKGVLLSLFLNTSKVSSSVLAKELCDFLPNAKIGGSASLHIMQANRFARGDLRNLNKQAHKYKVFSSLLISQKDGKVVVDTRFPGGDEDDEDTDEEEEDGEERLNRHEDDSDSDLDYNNFHNFWLFSSDLRGNNILELD